MEQSNESSHVLTEWFESQWKCSCQKAFRTVCQLRVALVAKGLMLKVRLRIHVEMENFSLRIWMLLVSKGFQASEIIWLSSWYAKSISLPFQVIWSPYYGESFETILRFNLRDASVRFSAKFQCAPGAYNVHNLFSSRFLDFFIYQNNFLLKLFSPLGFDLELLTLREREREKPHDESAALDCAFHDLCS